MPIGIVKQNRVETVFGNVSTEIDLQRVEAEILDAYHGVYGEKHGEEAIYATYGWYDILELVPSLQILRTTIVPTALSLHGLRPEDHKFKAWFNVCFEGEFLGRHVHEITNHGYMVITNYGSRTFFELEEKTVYYENKPGQVLHLFGRYWHGVTPNRSTKPRITVAWDVLRKDDPSRRIYYDMLPR